MITLIEKSLVLKDPNFFSGESTWEEQEIVIELYPNNKRTEAEDHLKNLCGFFSDRNFELVCDDNEFQLTDGSKLINWDDYVKFKQIQDYLRKTSL